MTIIQSAGGTFAGTSFTAALPSLGAASKMVVLVEADATVTTPAGWTLQKSLVNGAGHYWFERTAAGGATTQAFTTASGAGTWVAYEVSGVFSAAAAAEGAASSSYTSPAYTPPAGTADVLVSFVAEPNAAITYVSMTGGFLKDFTGQATTLDRPAGATGSQAVTASGTTAYSSTVTYSASMGTSGALIGSYSSTATASKGPVSVSWTGTAVPGAAAGSSVTTGTVNVAGAPNGDIVCILVGIATTQSPSGGIPAPTGWARVGIIDDANRVSAALLWKVKASTDTTVALTWATAGKFEAIPFAISGADTTTPFEGWTSTSTQTTSSAALVTPSVTPTAANRQPLGLWVARGATATFAPWTADVALTKAGETSTTVSAFISVMAALGSTAATQAAHTYASTPAASYGNAGSALVYVIPAATGGSETHTQVGAATAKATASGTAGHTSTRSQAGAALATASGARTRTAVAAQAATARAAATGTAGALHTAVGAAAAKATATGAAAPLRPGAATATGRAAASGTASAQHPSAGTATARAAASGPASSLHPAAGTATASAAASGTAAPSRPATGTATATAAASGTPSSSRTATGSAPATATAAGTAATTRSSAGTATAHATASGHVVTTEEHPRSGAATAQAAASGTATTTRAAAGTATGQATSSSTWATTRQQAGTATATASAAGSGGASLPGDERHTSTGTAAALAAAAGSATTLRELAALADAQALATLTGGTVHAGTGTATARAAASGRSPVAPTDGPLVITVGQPTTLWGAGAPATRGWAAETPTATWSAGPVVTTRGADVLQPSREDLVIAVSAPIPLTVEQIEVGFVASSARTIENITWSPASSYDGRRVFVLVGPGSPVGQLPEDAVAYVRFTAPPQLPIVRAGPVQVDEF